MDEVFRALADGSRRELLDRLRADNGQTLGDLCDRLNMTRQAVSKHLGILEEANLIATVKRGREKLHYLNPVPIHEIGKRLMRFNRSHQQVKGLVNAFKRTKQVLDPIWTQSVFEH
jgi:DNA-binding transcriptional ArsR family regulator